MSPALDERDRIRRDEPHCRRRPRTLQRRAHHRRLALEADVPRNALTQRYADLKTSSTNGSRNAAPRQTSKLACATVVKLKETITNKNKELNQLRADVPALVRTINQLTLETSNFANKLAHPDPNIIPFPSRR